MTYLASDVDLTDELAKSAKEEQFVPEWEQPVPAYGLSQWQVDSIVEILRLGNLQQDWDSYGSPPPGSQLIELAIRVVRSIPFDDLATPRVVPVAGGGIQIEWRVGQRELELTILPDRSVEFLKIERGEPCEESVFDEGGQLLSVLGWLQTA